MNNNRLSTNSNPIHLDENNKSEIFDLIKLKPLLHVDSQGRAKIISENKYIRSTARGTSPEGRSTYIIKVNFINGSFNYFTNGISCAKFLHVSNNTITTRLNDGKPVKNKEGLVVAQSIERVKAYSSNKSNTY